MTIPSMLALASATHTPAAWSPASLTGIAHWYDASVPGDLTLVSSTHVSQWNDKVGGKHLTCGTDADRPLYDTTVNGLNVVRWVSDDYVENTSMALNGTAITIFAAVYVSAGTDNNYGRVVSMSASTGGPDWSSINQGALLCNSGGAGYFIASAYRNGGLSSKNGPSWGTMCSVESKFDGTNHTMLVDGSAGTPVGSTGTFAGTHLRLGLHTQGGSRLVGVIGELAIVLGASSSPDEAAWLSYCQTKWGI